MTEIYNNYIGGRWTPSVSNETYASINPANTAEVLGYFQQSTEKDVEAAIKAAEIAFPSWANTSAPKRGDVIFKLIQLLEEHRESLATIIAKEVGKAKPQAIGEVNKTIEAMKQFSGEATRLTGETVPSHDPNIFGYTVREPLGVVAVIAPYNFPLGIGIWKIAPAIIAGNTVVFKPASNTSLISIKLIELFEEAGVPAGVINMVTGPGKLIGNALSTNEKIQALSFTGSTEVGLLLGEAVAKRGARMQAEMGGKNPSIVLEDANLDEVVKNLVISSFYDNGQRCTGTSRVIVLSSIAEALIQRLTEEAKAITIGNGLTEDVHNGPVIDEKQLQTYLHYVQIAIDEGATLHCGGKRLTENGLYKGYFVAPTVFSNVTKEMTIFKEEIFGPVVAITVVDTYEEALTLANDSTFGLSSTVYTNQLDKALHFVKHVESGVTHVNIPSNYFENQYPFGGKKTSSLGPREQGSTALDFWTDYKTVYIKA